MEDLRSPQGHGGGRARAGEPRGSSRRLLSVASIRALVHFCPPPGRPRCAVIGQTGDLAEFSRCIDDAWSGFTTKAQYAYFIAGEQMSNTAKQCQTALRSYRTVLANYQATLDVAHKYASNLQIDLMAPAFDRVPAATRRYVKFALNALAACEPK